MAAQSGVGGTIDLKYEDKIVTITMNRGQNRINDDFLKKMHVILDEIERYNIKSKQLINFFFAM